MDASPFASRRRHTRIAITFFASTRPRFLVDIGCDRLAGNRTTTAALTSLE
jgi:hypothetical protein